FPPLLSDNLVVAAPFPDCLIVDTDYSPKKSPVPRVAASGRFIAIDRRRGTRNIVSRGESNRDQPIIRKRQQSRARIRRGDPRQRAAAQSWHVGSRSGAGGGRSGQR